MLTSRADKVTDAEAAIDSARTARVAVACFATNALVAHFAHPWHVACAVRAGALALIRAARIVTAHRDLTRVAEVADCARACSIVSALAVS